jgi:hypothetical protein
MGSLKAKPPAKGLAPWRDVASRAIGGPREILATRHQVRCGEPRGDAGRVRAMKIRELDSLAFRKGRGIARAKQQPSGSRDCYQDNSQDQKFIGTAHSRDLAQRVGGAAKAAYFKRN